MSLRISSAALGAFFLAACQPLAEALPGDEVECAIGAGAEMGTACALERVADSDDYLLHHPGGGFRRIRFDDASGKVAALDGADAAMQDSFDGPDIIFAIGADRYAVPIAMFRREE
ncbi:MAG: hypothetical protein ACXIT4_08880 [Erythrobacter sp.]